MADDKFRKVAGVPHIDSAIPQNIARVLSALKMNWELALAHARETGAGIFSNPVESLPLPPALDDFIDSTVPPKPMNVRVAGGFAVITLDWDVPRYGNHSHAEIWRAESDDLTAAKVIGQTPGSVFSDPVGNNKTYWYWVRFVSMSNVTGAFHAASGLSASTSLDPDYALDVLASNYGAAPFYTLSAPTTIDGTVLPAGMYIKNAFVADGSIKRAKIGLGAIDEARIADAAITRAKIADAAIDSAKIANIIQSNNYGATTGWLINRDGTAYFNNLFARGTFQSSNYAPGAAGWRITNAGDAEFNTLVVRSANLYGAVHQSTAIPVFNPGTRHISTGGSDLNWKTVGSWSIAAPVRKPHRIAANFCCLARCQGTSLNDLDVRILVGGEEVALIVNTGQYQLSAALVGATSGLQSAAATVTLQVRGFNADYTIERVSGVIWTID